MINTLKNRIYFALELYAWDRTYYLSYQGGRWAFLCYKRFVYGVGGEFDFGLMKKYDDDDE